VHWALLVHVRAAGLEQFHLQATHKIQGDSKLSIHGENGLCFKKTYSIWASRASAQENDFYSLYRRSYFSILQKRKMQLIPLHGDF